MCGIAGIMFADSSRPVARASLKAMADRIAHRGPDAEGFLVEPGLGLAHRRLSIIDLAGGDQPIGNEDDSIQIVFNGEIYNYQTLRAELEHQGHHFRTNSDTEVLVHLYEEQGEQLVESLRGMFAFALWDRPRRRLLLARDRLGIKPLYFYRDAERLLFASEPKAILAFPDIKASVDPLALEDYLAFGMVPSPRSIFQGIEKLPAGHTLTIHPEAWKRSPRCYWQLRMEPDDRTSLEEWQEALRAKLQEAVSLHLIADVPVGAFLSGGFDSSVIVASCAESASEPLRTFSMGFAEESHSELPYAKAVADQYGTVHTTEIVRPDAVSLLDELTEYFDEPFADSSALPTFVVARLASSAVKVALSGDGGDEAFGGYTRYAHDAKEAVVRQLLPRWLRQAIVRPLAASWPKADWLPRPLRAKTALTNLALDPANAYANTLTLCRPPLRRRLLTSDLCATLNGYQPEQTIRSHFASAHPSDPLGGMMAADLGTLLPDRFLVKVDRASMAHGLEVRPPFLDHELMELACRIPSRWKVRGGETKWIFKRTFADKLPAAVQNHKKQGFDIPTDGWLRGPLKDLVEDVVLSPRSPVANWIDQARARQLHRAHQGGVGRHGDVLWALLVLARWANRYLAPCSAVTV